VHLLKDGGQQHAPDYRAVNPQELIPTLVHDGHAIGQSLAIIEYLDEVCRSRRFCPAIRRPRARAPAGLRMVACDIHPVNNLRVLLHLRDDVRRIGREARRLAAALDFAGLRRYREFARGSPETGRFCHGDTPTLADICLIPQMANARRVNLDLASYPTILRIEHTALAHPAFAAALPAAQPDAE
jgi:maleylacetoacetate isomerase